MYPSGAPALTPSYTQVPLSRLPTPYPRAPPARVRSHTSVGALPNIIIEGVVAGALAADDVDGAGAVDHGRVPRSASPRRAGRTAHPHGTCSKRALIDKRTRGAGDAGRAINTAGCCRATRVPGQTQSHTRSLHTHTHIQTPTHTIAHVHALTDTYTHARTHARTHIRKHTHTRTHTHARARTHTNGRTCSRTQTHARTRTNTPKLTLTHTHTHTHALPHA